MSSAAATDLFREGLLTDVRMVVAGPEATPGAIAAGGDFALAIGDGCTGLGAKVVVFPISHDASPELQEQQVEMTLDGAMERLGAIELLVVDGDGLLAEALARGEEEREALVSCLDQAWSVTRALAARAFIAREVPGRIVYVAPASGSSAEGHREVARAAFENLSRTLSIEWARYGITPLTIAPGESTSPQEMASLTAYLSSPAGAYFSGCLLDLRGSAS
jgi:NAD(P)-dependent dehydrogenase (short-subunit alcohol dehydrogenase family)